MNDDDELKQTQPQPEAGDPAADDDMGAIKVADEVLSIVAGLAASEVNGVYGMSGGIREGLTDMLGKQNFSKGIKVYTEGHTVRVEVHVIITYGFNIPDVAIKLQEKVKEAVESMTGYEVTGVDIHVEGVKKKKEKSQLEKDDTDELVKKWEEEPDEPKKAQPGTLPAPQEAAEPTADDKEAPAEAQPEETTGEETSGGDK